MTFSKDGSGQDTPNMPDELGASQVDSAAPTTPVMSPVSLGEAKVSVHALPAGVKAGDMVTMKVSRVDAAKNCAYLVQEGSEDVGPATEDNMGGEKEGSEETTDGAVDQSQPNDKGIDTGLLMGPMSNLKNYLAQKSVDNQTRTYVK